MNTINDQCYRAFGYVWGFIFFFAPFALFQRGILYLLGQNYDPTIHTLCFRIPIEHILDGRFFAMGTVSVIGTIILLSSAFFVGPLFCGKLCPAGAVPEYLSKIVPPKFKINWNDYVSVVPLRYGFLVGFLIAPLLGGYLACSYCNYYVFDLLANFVFWDYAVAFSSSLLLTLILWLLLFGIFTQGGRGFCNFFCPVGALQNFVYYFGSKFSFTWRLKVDKDKCVQCGLCVKKCPMTCMNLEKTAVQSNIHHCILCLQCIAHCPYQAITYDQGRKDEKEWEKKSING